MRKNIAFLAFDDVQAVDFAAPMEVFAVADLLGARASFHLFIAALSPGTVRTQGGLKLVPDFTLENCPFPHVIVIPGGRGTAALLHQFSLHEWLRRQAKRAEAILAVGDGALVLAKAGLITKTGRDTPADGIITVPGVIAAMTAALELVGRLAGPELASRTMAHLAGHKNEVHEVLP